MGKNHTVTNKKTVMIGDDTDALRLAFEGSGGSILVKNGATFYSEEDKISYTNGANPKNVHFVCSSIVNKDGSNAKFYDDSGAFTSYRDLCNPTCEHDGVIMLGCSTGQLHEDIS